MNQMVSTYYASYRAPLFATALLVLTLFQASTFNLSLAFRGPLASDSLVSLVTLMWLAMYGCATVGLFVSFGLNWITWLVRYRLLLICLLAGTAFSVAWSVDTALSAERSIHLIGTTVVALYLGLSLPLSRVLRTSALVLGIIMGASLIAALLIPDLGLENYQGKLVWTGTLASKNTLGFWAAITFLLSASLCFWTVPTLQRLQYSAIALISLLCLYNSVSATSLLALITAGLVMLYMHAAFSLRLSIFAMMFLGLLVAGISGIAFVFIDTAELIGRSGDLTGRGEVWSQTWQLILNRPLTGYGYGTIWFPTEDSLWIQQSLTDFSWTVFHAHNGLLQVASEIGLPLTALALLMILQQLIEIIYCQYQRQQPGVLFVLGFVVALLVSNYSEARLLINRELFWIFFIALPISMLQQVSVTATRTNPNLVPGGVAANDPNKLRDARKRKGHKLSMKERMKKLDKLRVINPKPRSEKSSDVDQQHDGYEQERWPDSIDADSMDSVNRSAGSIDGPSETIAVNVVRHAGKKDARRRQKNLRHVRRQNKAG